MIDLHSDTLEDEDFDTILSSDIDFSGTLSFEKPFLIRGKVRGEIIATGLLMIDQEGVVDAQINAPQVIVRGLVNGDITAADKIEVSPSGRLQGNITTQEIALEAGCHFNGYCTMHEKKSGNVPIS
ncbi:MAG: polymer-forming cytoskeletal protein [Treponema sp.]|jgi:cytoskeletal protein CcmA (bactofilin family)|nr:polymer-forming cytoskeletal protein [Treponema sp.]